MANSERIAAAAHLHVALRRKAGRVTDTDWMAVNDVYAQAMVRLAHEKAQELHDPSLAELASRLDALLQAESATKAAPLVQRVSQGLREVARRRRKSCRAMSAACARVKTPWQVAFYTVSDAGSACAVAWVGIAVSVGVQALMP